MRNRFLSVLVPGFLIAGLIVFTAFPAAAQLVGTDTAPGSSCAGKPAGATRVNADPDQDGAEVTLICDGSIWNPEKVAAAAPDRGIQFNSGGVLYASSGLVFTSTYDLGVKQAAPKAPLHVGGEAIIGVTTGLACDADRTGGIRWSSAESTIEMCDGTSWRKIAATAGATDCTPDAFSFTDVTDQPLSSIILSNTLNITGIDPGCTVSVSGAGTPKIRVNGGSWVTATDINPGDSLQAQMISSATVSTEQIAAVTVGTTTDNWSVTTKAGQTRIFATSGTYTGNMGGIGGAHTNCQTAAGILGYGGLWRALLSHESYDAKDMLSITYPVVRASNTSITVDATNLWDGSIQNQIDTSGGRVHTGTKSDGTKYGNNNTCSNWRSATGGTAVAKNKSATNQDWVYCGPGVCFTDDCSDAHPIYCVEQASSLGAILTISPTSKTGMDVIGTGSPATGSAETFTVENIGDTTSATMSTSLSNTTNFEFVTDNCNGNTLAQGATCTVSIRPKATIPGGEGPISGTFNVTANNNPSASLSGLADANAIRIFRTAGTYNGDLGGIGGAHSECQTAAGVLGYSGLWRALLSHDNYNVKDMLSITYPVLRASDTGVTVDSTDLWSGILENGVHATGGRVWTGSTTSGTANTGETCNNWRGSGNGTWADGNVTTTGWIDKGFLSCSGNIHSLYCVEQASSLGAILAMSPASQGNMDVIGTGSPAYGSAVTFTVDNIGDTTSATMSTSLSNTTNFEFVTDNCNGNTLAQGATCTVSIRPKATNPGGEGPISGTFNVTANNNPSASLSGRSESAVTRIFRTASVYRGDSLGGLTGADAICQSEATTKGYSGTWKAILSDDSTNAKDRLTIAYPVIRANDSAVTVDGSNLWDGGLTYRVNDNNSNAWTGTDSDGTTYTGETCSNWSGGVNGRRGDTDIISSNWLTWGSTACTASLYLYCVDGQ